MKGFVLTLAVLAASGIGIFLVMGIQSRAGHAPGPGDDTLASCGERPNCVSSLAPAEAVPYVPPYEFAPGDADAAWSALVESIVELGGTITADRRPYLAATFSSRVFGFVDDFECLLREDAARIHVRAGARVGYSDLGVNRRRVELVRERFAGRAQRPQG